MLSIGCWLVWFCRVGKEEEHCMGYILADVSSQHLFLKDYKAKQNGI